MRNHFEHLRKHMGDLMLPASGQKGNHRFMTCFILILRTGFFSGRFYPALNLIHKGIAQVFNINSMLFIKCDFEREYYIHAVNKLFYFLHPVLFPGPQFWRDKIIDLKPSFPGKFSYPQVEGRVVDQYHCIGIKFSYMFFAEREVF